MHTRSTGPSADYTAALEALRTALVRVPSHTRREELVEWAAHDPSLSPIRKHKGAGADLRRLLERHKSGRGKDGQSLVTRVVLDEAATEQTVQAVERVLRTRNINVKPEPIYGRRSPDGPAVVVVTLAVSVAAFFASFGTQDRQDPYAGFRDWLSDLWRARTTSGDVVVDIVDPLVHHHLPINTRRDSRRST